MKEYIKKNDEQYDYIEINRSDLNDCIESINNSGRKVEDLKIIESSFKEDVYNVYIKYKQ